MTAVAGVGQQMHTFYMGSTGGGVFRTDDAGQTWKNLTDGQLKSGSIGAIAVAPSDPNVIYVGTGSACPRGNVSAGDGIYRSTYAGKTWTHIGLPEAGQIGKIRVHPQNPDLV
ncbi:MAG: WD40/YVTN/BNR-like repeat-containing protein, partial [Thermoplasmata archaeon]